MASTLNVIGHLQAKDLEVKKKILEKISAIAAYSCEHEPKVTKYCLAEVRDAEDDLHIYVLEEYADQETFDIHMASPIVKAMIEYMTSKPDLLSAVPDVAMTTSIGKVTKASVEDLSDPFIVYAHLDYKPDTFAEGVEGWKEIVSNTDKTEDFVPVYMCLKDNNVANRVRMLEVYNDKHAFDKHCATALLGKKMGDEARLKAAEPNVAFLKKVTGYWYK